MNLIIYFIIKTTHFFQNHYQKLIKKKKKMRERERERERERKEEEEMTTFRCLICGDATKYIDLQV
jgi:hypothetical protein